MIHIGNSRRSCENLATWLLQSPHLLQQRLDFPSANIHFSGFHHVGKPSSGGGPKSVQYQGIIRGGSLYAVCIGPSSFPRPSVWVSNFSPKRSVFGGFFGAQISHPNGGFRYLYYSNQKPKAQFFATPLPSHHTPKTRVHSTCFLLWTHGKKKNDDEFLHSCELLSNL